MKISIIVAVAENGAIGKGNQLPWHLPNDLKFFKNKTMGHHMIMGRKTYESIGRALPGRTTIIVTRQKNYYAPDCFVIHSLKEATQLAASRQETEAFVIGGAAIINEATDIADKIYLTEVKMTVEDADVYLDNFDRNNWEEKSRETHAADDKHAFPYAFVELTRKNNL